MRVSELRKNIRKHKVITYPGQNFEVAIVRLTQGEIIEANARTTKRLGEQPIFNSDVIAIMEQLEQLSLALRNPNNLEERIIDRKELEEEDPFLVDQLYQELSEIQIDKSDTIDEITKEDFEELKKKLKKMDWKDFDGESLKTLNYLRMTLVSKEDTNN